MYSFLKEILGVPWKFSNHKHSSLNNSNFVSLPATDFQFLFYVENNLFFPKDVLLMTKYFFTISLITISNNYRIAASLFSSDLQTYAGTTGA